MDLAGMLEGGREDDLDREPLDCVGEQYSRSCNGSLTRIDESFYWRYIYGSVTAVTKFDRPMQT